MELVIKRVLKSVNGTQIFHWEVSTGKTGLPFQEFRLFRKVSSRTNQKVVFHLQPDRNFRNFLVNGKRSLSHRSRNRVPLARMLRDHQREITAIVRRKMAESGRNTRLSSGYAEDFVNAVEEDLQCSICHLPLKEPVLTRCGHRFCKECLEEHFRRLVVTCGFIRRLKISG